MEEDKINWRSIKVTDEMGQSKFLMDEICCYNFKGEGWRGVPKFTTDWKPEVWYGYNEKGELIYNKFDEEE